MTTGAALGTNTKSASIPPGRGVRGGSCPPAMRTRRVREGTLHLDTGEVVADWSPVGKWRLLDAARDLLPDERVAKCHHLARGDKHGAANIEIRRHGETGRHSVGNVGVCGSVWACPVCAGRIQPGRADEVRAAIEAHKARGGNVAMLTQTAPHTRAEPLAECLARFKGAQRKFKSGRAYQALGDAFGIGGSIQALEVTHGANGWHVHAHTILFLPAGAHRVNLRRAAFVLWARACRRAGLDAPSYRHGLTVQDASEVQTYLTKMGTEYEWSAEHELVKAATKRGRGSSSPFDLLRRYVDGDAQAGALYAEYAAAFKGRRQLVWSRGLRDDLLPGREELTDAELAEAGDDTEVVYEFTRNEWNVIARRRLIGHVLALANEHGAAALHSVSAFCGASIAESAARRGAPACA